MDYKNIILEKGDGIATITLNRPDKMNALNQEMADELFEAVKEVGEDDGVRVMVLTGAGRAFCGGGDVDSPMFSITESRVAEETVDQFGRVTLALSNLTKPSIASINGVAAGGSCGYALACDIVIAAENAKFILPYVNVALHPDCGCTYLLPRAVGVNKACELIFTGDLVDAKEAERIGLVNKVVPADQLGSITRGLAEKIAKGPPIALSLAKASIHKGMTMDLASVLEMETKSAAITLLTEDCKEGARAFMEKRPPQFKGK
ncbi:enoyl-CoA hydratase/isomerase family protein [Chloroflexota bacterium]